MGIWVVTHDPIKDEDVIAGSNLARTAAPDVVFAEDGDDIVVGGGDNDYLDGGIGEDSISGTEGNGVPTSTNDDDWRMAA